MAMIQTNVTNKQISEIIRLRFFHHAADHVEFNNIKLFRSNSEIELDEKGMGMTVIHRPKPTFGEPLYQSHIEIVGLNR